MAMAYSNRMTPGCQYFALCKEFFKSLKIDDSLFDHTYDMCYCERCHNWRGDRNTYTRGNPPKEYGIPVGWTRFSLQEQPSGKALNADDNWHRAFHGTPVSCIKPILRAGVLVPAGRNVETGVLEICHDEVGREDYHVYLSPSIRYAGYYGDPRLYLASDGRTYSVRAAIYVFINPRSYKIKPGIIRHWHQRDPNFRKSELEWYSDVEGGHKLYGVMVHMERAWPAY